MVAPAFDFRELDEKSKLWAPVTEKRRAEILRELSPINHITSHTPPTLIIQGDADTLVPLQQGESFIAKLKEAHVDGDLVVKPGLGHGWPMIGPDMERCADWFDTHLLKKNSLAKNAATQPSRAE